MDALGCAMLVALRFSLERETHANMTLSRFMTIEIRPFLSNH